MAVNKRSVSFFLLLILSGWISGRCYAQKQGFSFQNDFTFANYLIEQNEFDEAIFLIRQMEPKSLGQTDSLNYLLGWAFYSNKQLEHSVISFSRVGEGSLFYPKSRFFAAYNSYHLGRISQGDSLLRCTNFEEGLHADLQNFQLAGAALLQKDIEGFDKRAVRFQQHYYQFSKEEVNLKELRDRIENFKPKSTVVAGLMSVILPGSGKIYTGHTGEGISSFLTVAILGALAWENYHKAGTSNAKTWIFGSGFALAYSANIFGSVYSVKAYRDEFDKHITKGILFNLHIPIRNCFN